METLENRTLLAADFGYALGLEMSADSITDLVTIDARGDVYTASRFTGTVQPHGLIGGEVAPPTFTSAGGYDTLIAK